MARNVSVTMRWIERNISDEPSRIYATEVSKLLVDLLTEEWSRHGRETVSDVDSWEGDYCQEPGTEQARSKEAALTSIVWWVIVLQVQYCIFRGKFSNSHDEKISAYSPGQALRRAGRKFFLWP